MYVKLIKQVILVGTLFFISAVVFSQESLDSMQIVDAKKEFAGQLLKKGKYIQASKVYKKGLRFIPTQEIEEKILLLYDLGRTYQISRDIDSANYFYNKAELFYNDTLSSFIKSYRYQAKASVYHGSMQIDSTTHYALASLEYALLSKKKRQVFNCQITLGKVFLSQNVLKKAKLYFNKALETAKMMSDSIAIYKATSFRGQVALEQKNYINAESDLRKALVYFEKENDLLGIFFSKGHLSKLYMTTGKLDKSVKLGFELLPIINQFEFRKDVKKLVSKANKIATYVDKDSIDQQKIMKSEELSQQTIEDLKLPQAKVEYGKGLVNYYKNNELAIDFKKEFQNKMILGKELETIIKTQDSLYRNSINAKYTEWETKFQTERKEKENLELKQENTEQELALVKENKRKWISIIAFLTALLVLLVFLYFFRKTSIQKKMIEKLQRELHHRIKNNLAIIDTFIDTAKDDITDEKGFKKLEELQNRIDSIYKVHELLYKAEVTITEVPAKEYVTTLVDGVQQSFSETPVTILMNIDATMTLSAEQSFPVGLIINEFLTNSYKYAFNELDTGKITIDISCDKVYYQIRLTDNGIGFSKDFDIDALDSFGIDVMRLLAKQLEGSFDLKGDNGVSLELQFVKK